jgi:hypothetical protein
MVVPCFAGFLPTGWEMGYNHYIGSCQNNASYTSHVPVCVLLAAFCRFPAHCLGHGLQPLHRQAVETTHNIFLCVRAAVILQGFCPQAGRWATTIT